MRKGRLGFTLIEVSLFLAVTAALFVGVTVGVQSSINNQRYTDSVQSYMEFLRNVYAGVLNVQNDVSGGRSGEAIYGRLVTFGETTDLAGNPVGDPNTIFVYTVVGNVLKNSTSASAIDVLRDTLHADVAKVKEENGRKSLNLAGFPESYVPKWGTQIEVACTNSGCPNERLRGMLLVVRHPSSWVVYTYFKQISSDSDASNQINQAVAELGRRLSTGDNVADARILNLGGIGDGNLGGVDFCVRPNAEGGNTRRSDVRIAAQARNSSAIELIAEEAGDNKCRN